MIDNNVLSVPLWRFVILAPSINVVSYLLTYLLNKVSVATPLMYNEIFNQSIFFQI